MALSVPLRNCYFLLPGNELDGYPRTLTSEEAEKLLSGWVALWHPAIIATTGTVPSWEQAEHPPSDVGGAIVVLPPITASAIDEEFKSSCNGDNTLLLDAESDWRAFQSKLLVETGLATDNVCAQDSLSEALCVDFAALGYAFLQIQLMTRQLRYTSNLDTLLFSEQASNAAAATVAGDREKAEELLQACFDTLGQERDHYYSLDVNLLDITLLADTTLGKSLKRQADETGTTNFLASASLLRQLHSDSPEIFAAIAGKLDDNTADIVGGLDSERPHPLLTRDAFLRDMARGKKAYESLGIRSPAAFGRLSYGMTSEHATDLRRFGFAGAFLIAWMEGTYPDGSQAKISWESSDGTNLPAIATDVLDAADANSFLSLGWLVGEALDNQHVPTILFAHWPARSSPFFQLLQAVSRRTPALGQWMTAKEYFANTDAPYHQERLNSSAFRFNWLAKSDSPDDLIAATKRAHILQARVRSLQNLANLTWQLEYRSPKPEDAPPAVSDAQSTPDQSTPDQPTSSTTEEEAISGHDLSAEEYCPELAAIMDIADELVDAPESSESAFETGLELANELTETLSIKLGKLLAAVEPAETETQNSSNSPSSTGELILNSRSCPLRVRVRTEAKQTFVDEDWNFATGRVGHDRYTCIDVPPMGFCLAPYTSEPSKQKVKTKNLADAGGLVQNEFFEAQIDVTRGHLRSLHIPARRGNRLSLMIARRDRDTDGTFVYSDMIASDVRMCTSSNVCGLVRSTGKLELKGQLVGKFEIDYEAWRGSRILEVSIRLTDLQPLASDNPWRSAYVARLAWPNEAASLKTYPAGRKTNWASGQAVSPTLIEIDETDYCTHYLPGGLAFHRRTDERFLETILAAGCSSVEHVIGLAVDLPHPTQSANDFLDRRYALPVRSKQRGNLADTNSPSLSSQHGWLATCDVKSVTIDLENPLVDQHGRVIGLRLLLTECQGKSTSTKITLMHTIGRARRMDNLGNASDKLISKDDTLTIALRSNEQCAVEVFWA